MVRPSISRAQAGMVLGRGSYMHGAAVDLHGKGGLLITGVSGAGKSTLARLLDDRGARILADDIVLAFRDTGGRYLLQPGADDDLWSMGEGPVPLSAIVFVEKGPGFCLHPLASEYSFYRAVRDGILWSEVYRYHRSGEDSARARRDLASLLEATTTLLLRWDRSDPDSSVSAAKALMRVP